MQYVSVCFFNIAIYITGKLNDQTLFSYIKNLFVGYFPGRLKYAELKINTSLASYIHFEFHCQKLLRLHYTIILLILISSYSA